MKDFITVLIEKKKKNFGNRLLHFFENIIPESRHLGHIIGLILFYTVTF